MPSMEMEEAGTEAGPELLLARGGARDRQKEVEDEAVRLMQAGLQQDLLQIVPAPAPLP